MFVQLQQEWQGKPAGERIDLADEHAAHLVERGVATPIDDPTPALLTKAVDQITGQLSERLDRLLERFALAQTRSRRHAIPQLLGEANARGDASRTFGDWLLAVRRNDQRTLFDKYGSEHVAWDAMGAPLRKGALTTQAGAQGGYTVPAEFLPRLMDVAAENAVVRPRATKLPMTARSIQVPVLDLTTAPAAGDSAFLGGLVARWTEEAANLNETEPTFKQVELLAHELSGYAKVSNALMADSAVGLETLLVTLFGNAIGWYEDHAFLRGDGVGKPLGALTWPGFLAVTRSGPSAFGLADYAGVLARWLPNFNRAASCWVCHPTVLAKLFQMADAEGHVIFIDNARERPQMMLGGLPLVVSEKLPALNTAGDIFLADWSKYLIGDRQQVEIAFSDHAGFTTNQTYWRFVSRVAGQPWLRDKITLADASTTVSPFVGLAAG
jgi:HK97 family phage major capsid protein